jgi:hypothetical protein
VEKHHRTLFEDLRRNDYVTEAVLAMVGNMLVEEGDRPRATLLSEQSQLIIQRAKDQLGGTQDTAAPRDDATMSYLLEPPQPPLEESSTLPTLAENSGLKSVPRRLAYNPDRIGDYYTDNPVNAIKTNLEFNRPYPTAQSQGFQYETGYGWTYSAASKSTYGDGLATRSSREIRPGHSSARQGLGLEPASGSGGTQLEPRYLNNPVPSTNFNSPNEAPGSQRRVGMITNPARNSEPYLSVQNAIRWREEKKRTSSRAFAASLPHEYLLSRLSGRDHVSFGPISAVLPNLTCK